MKQYIVDAFAEHVFEGNPAAVCVMDEWLPDGLMKKIAMENALSETAFAVNENGRWHLRWFTPGSEVDLCGHATLAAAFTLANFYRPEQDAFEFDTLSGRLRVERNGERFTLDFPSRMPESTPVTDDMTRALNGLRPIEAYMSRDLMLVVSDERSVREFEPDFAKIAALDMGMGLLITARADGSRYDFVSRCFFPKIRVNEDPVCGSAHCNFVPYWAERLGKDELTARQLSNRGGTLWCRNADSRVFISGRAVLYAESEIHF